MFNEATLNGLNFPANVISRTANLRFLRGFNFANDQFFQILRRLYFLVTKHKIT